MRISSEAEYNTLRDELINEMSQQTDLRIAMCTITIAVLTFAIQQKSSILSLMAFAVIIPFRLLIHNKQLGILKLSAYIIVQFEEKCASIKWESTSEKFYNKSSRYLTVVHWFAASGNCVATILSIVTCLLNVFFLNTNHNVSQYILLLTCTISSVALDIGFKSTVIRDKFKEEFRAQLRCLK